MGLRWDSYELNCLWEPGWTSESVSGLHGATATTTPDTTVPFCVQGSLLRWGAGVRLSVIPFCLKRKPGIQRLSVTSPTFFAQVS